MKICKYCLKEQPDEAFEVCRVIGDRVYRRLRCHACKRSTANLRRSRLRRWLDDYKKSLRCERCGFSDFRALEFHHVGSSDKDFNVSQMISSGLSIAAVQREIEKCIVLCSNCHRIEHYDERR